VSVHPTGAVRRRELNGAVGLVVFLGTLAMLFAAMLFAYAVVRLQAPSWPPPGTPAFPQGGAAANGLLLLATSFGLRAATRRRGWAVGALALGTGFLVAQIVLWRQLVTARLGPGAGALGDVFFALSALHAVHVQHVIHQREQVLARTEDVVGVSIGSSQAARLLQLEQFGKSQHRVQRRSHLMADA